MIELIINGNRAEFTEGKTLLECIGSAGIKVPTLCHHKALSPYGACRLCLVEVEQEGRAPSIQASCSYPASAGLSIKTDSERVRSARKIIAELLLARCPDSESIRRIASELGVEEPGSIRNMMIAFIADFVRGFAGREWVEWPSASLDGDQEEQLSRHLASITRCAGVAELATLSVLLVRQYQI